MKISYGKGDLGRIYEKLRKRSYRTEYSDHRHHGYVEGVRDALTEVADLVQRERVRAYAKGFEDGLETQDLERA